MRFEVHPEAYATALLHAIQHPSQTIVGLLLGKEKNSNVLLPRDSPNKSEEPLGFEGNEAITEVTYAIPLTHSHPEFTHIADTGVEVVTEALRMALDDDLQNIRHGIREEVSSKIKTNSQPSASYHTSASLLRGLRIIGVYSASGEAEGANIHASAYRLCSTPGFLFWSIPNEMVSQSTTTCGIQPYQFCPQNALENNAACLAQNTDDLFLLPAQKHTYITDERTSVSGLDLIQRILQGAQAGNLNCTIRGALTPAANGVTQDKDEKPYVYSKKCGIGDHDEILYVADFEMFLEEPELDILNLHVIRCNNPFVKK